jgi:hypothetical protein
MVAQKTKSRPTDALEFWGDVFPAISDLPVLGPTEESVLSHHRSVIKMAKTFKDESMPVLAILNILSLAHASARDPQSAKVHVFYFNPYQQLYGDHLNTQCKPNIICCLRERHEAERYLDHLTSAGDLEPLGKGRPYWQEVTAVGSFDGPFNSDPRMTRYLDPMLRYRPDLSTAYGILAVKDNFTVYKLEPYTLQHLEESSWDSIEALQQFVAAIYYASEMRNSTLEFVPQGQGLWSMTLEEKTFYMYPFYVGRLPGKGTWVAAGYRSDDGSRSSQPLIFKLSWGVGNHGRLEGAMYDLAHRDGWIPGLARPVLWSSPGISMRHRSKRDKITILHRHCIVLESAGSPLSGCDTVLDILKCMYDLLEGENKSLWSSLTKRSFGTSKPLRKRRPSSRH